MRKKVLTSLALLIALTGTAHSAEYRFYHPDPLGSNIVVTDLNGEVVQRTVTTPYGETRSAVNTNGQSVGQSANRTCHLFTGKNTTRKVGCTITA